MSDNTSQANADRSAIGAATRRVDGRLKVTGAAKYAADHHLEGMAYAYGVFSTVASGRISKIDTDAARKLPGVIDIFHRGHFSNLYRVPKTKDSPTSKLDAAVVDEHRLPFEDDKVSHAGQFVALVVAETFEQARAAAYAVKVSYEAGTVIANLDQAVKAHGVKKAGSGHERGNAAEAFDQAALKVDATYGTPVETHNPMEMHATVASWKDGKLHVYESTQGVVVHRATLARVFGVTPDRVNVEAPFIGSGFGSKLWAWPHAIAASAAAREVGRPVQLVIPRMQMFTTTGHRPETRQHMRLATDAGGKLSSVRHESINTTSFIDQYTETCGGVTQGLYVCPNVLVSHSTTEVNHGTPTSMRAPGAAPGLFALESAIDEMALAANLDPLEFRKRNFAEMDESQKLPWSSNHLLEAYDRGAAKFGWDKRLPEVGSMREGSEVIGYGMAACNWEAFRTPADARVGLRADGTIEVTCGVQDIGTGTYTIVAQAVSAVTGVPLERIKVRLGDASFPAGPVSGGSWATASVLPAVAKATRDAIDQLKVIAAGADSPFAKAKPDTLKLEGGKLTDGKQSVDFGEVLKSQKVAAAEAEAHTDANTNDKLSFRSFGAHFVEVRWDAGISRLRVSRVVSAIDVGRIINSKTAANQVEGAVVMAIGMALFEATEYDERTGLPVNNNYAEYVVPVHADQPEIDVILLDYPDYGLNEFGARGIGEIGTTGLAAAVANAVYHATGKRVRQLPITLEKLMDPPVSVAA
ncbi:xanthine dehydrogenase family protein molybdopterin-binding subunit [Pigmentiphaga aceris]|uniref:Xanthine dehydrogenase family protein molybdopterin-binding subunit n=1 Tax=Pigmentiphaga aceris TaxID=1940612 RepID=A0A5C0AYH5_9BURK|nr:xanthine dehydrogenase family protein molybdopterin-binding subunit [Pigmentiphaga aceris]QEI06654.1 xanthine dehydrogenase family protein molybdopterin-binding subunit [Pigmentiphaga aceris]